MPRTPLTARNTTLPEPSDDTYYVLLTQSRSGRFEAVARQAGAQVLYGYKSQAAALKFAASIRQGTVYPVTGYTFNQLATSADHLDLRDHAELFFNSAAASRHAA